MKFNRYLPWLVGLTALIAYAVNAAPSIVTLFDDSLEFQLVGPTLGIAHPTGYPLYVLLSAIWSRLLWPIGNWAWRMNLFSALCAGAAVGILTRLAEHLYNIPANLSPAGARLKYAAALAALTAAAAFGFSEVWWRQATIAEVYTLHLLFVTLLLYMTIRIGDACERPIWLFLCLGLALAHHRTVVLLAPGILLYIAWRRPDLLRPQIGWGWWAGALLAPLLLYLYIPARAAMGVADLHGSYVNSWRGFWQHVMASGYTAFFSHNELSTPKSLADWLPLFAAQLGVIGLALALFGLWPMVVKRTKEAALLLTVLVFNLLFAILYQTPDVEVFTLPVTLCLALLAGAASLQLTIWVARWRNAGTAQFAQIALLIPVALGLGGRGRLVDRSQEWDMHDYAVAMAKVDYPPQSHVVGLEGEITALRYMQQAEGLGMLATGIVADNPSLRRDIVAALVADDQPTYLTRELAGIDELYSFSAAGPLVRVWPRGQVETPLPTRPLQIPFATGELLLVGADALILAQAGGPTLYLALYWQPQAQLLQEFKVSLRLIDPMGKVLVQQDLFPLRHVATTNQWLPGETVQDAYYLRVPPNRYANRLIEPVQLLLILYDAQTTDEVGRWQIELP